MICREVLAGCRFVRLCVCDITQIGGEGNTDMNLDCVSYISSLLSAPMWITLLPGAAHIHTHKHKTYSPVFVTCEDTNPNPIYFEVLDTYTITAKE